MAGSDVSLWVRLEFYIRSLHAACCNASWSFVFNLFSSFFHSLERRSTERWKNEIYKIRSDKCPRHTTHQQPEEHETYFSHKIMSALWDEKWRKIKWCQVRFYDLSEAQQWCENEWKNVLWRVHFSHTNYIPSERFTFLQCPMSVLLAYEFIRSHLAMTKFTIWNISAGFCVAVGARTLYRQRLEVAITCMNLPTRIGFYVRNYFIAIDRKKWIQFYIYENG